MGLPAEVEKKLLSVWANSCGAGILKTTCNDQDNWAMKAYCQFG